MRQLSFAFPNELIIDNFAGGGGASYAIEQAFGRDVDIAINHDPEAIAMHKANHPNTKHYCESVWDVDPLEATQGRNVGLAWFSPDCKHFSKAKGGKPVDKNIRGLAWVVIRWAKMVRPRVIVLENVEEFQTWGPVIHLVKDGERQYHDDGKPVMQPCKKRRGVTFHKWKRDLERLGYKVEWQELKACDFGAPTIRKRLFLVARRDGLPIRWPKITHGQGKRLKPYRTAAECIDWSIPCPSIFTRKRPLVENTMKRIAKGLQRYVFEHADPFIVSLNHTASYYQNFRGQSLDDPLNTITRIPGMALVTPFVNSYYGNKGKNDHRGQSFTEALRTQTTENRFALVSAFIAKHFGGAVGCSIETPLPTTTTRGTQNQIVTSHMIKMRGTCKDGQDMREPAPCITAGGTHIGEVRAFLYKYYGSGLNAQDCRGPLHTITVKERFGLVTILGEQYQIVDIGMRMLSPRELYTAQGFPLDYIIELEYNGKPLTKTAQVRMVGNSVSPHPAIALVSENVGEIKQVEAA